MEELGPDRMPALTIAAAAGDIPMINAIYDCGVTDPEAKALTSALRAGVGSAVVRALLARENNVNFQAHCRLRRGLVATPMVIYRGKRAGRYAICC